MIIGCSVCKFHRYFCPSITKLVIEEMSALKHSFQSLYPTLTKHVTCSFHTTASVNHIIKLTRLRVVDNSEIGKLAMAEGKPPKCIHVYNKKEIGTIGDKILVAIRGQKKKAIVVGCKHKVPPPFIPRFDTNNIVLIDDNGTPLGTRIHVPIPTILRTILKEKNVKKGVDYTKLLALATRFV